MSHFKLIKYFFIAVVLLVSCRGNVVEIPDVTNSSKLVIYSSPRGAEIFLNEYRLGRTTPDSLVNIQPGSYEVKLRLTGYPDEIAYVTISSGQRKLLNIVFRNH